MKNVLNGKAWLAVAFLALLTFACKKKDPDVVAGFTFASDVADFKKVTFRNASQNFTTLSWNFGDNTAVSAETDPVHTYAAAGEYSVSLTATSLDGKSTDVSTQKVIVADPNAQLTALAGSLSKTWKLHRGVSLANNSFPLQVGPFDRSAIWWGVGRDEAMYKRACMLNDEWTFGRDGSMKYDSKGDTWGEGSVDFKVKDVCIPTTAAGMQNSTGVSLLAWGDGTHKFRIQAGAKPTLTVIGKGAFIGLQKVGTDLEYKLPQDSVTYNIVKLTDAAVDTMILEVNYKFAAADANPGGYWRFVLVSYDNPSQEPAIPEPTPEASYTSVTTGMTVAFTNTSKNITGATFAWDFGDGTTTTTKDASRTYAASGFYTVKMTATTAAGVGTTTKEVFVTNQTLTDVALQGAAWKVRADDNSIIVGPGFGNGDWYKVPKADLVTGTWNCLANDEFTFGAGGVFNYNTKGDARNDGYMGQPTGCMTDAQLAASGNGSAFKTATHSYTLTPAAGTTRAKLKVTNGASGSAFVGFYKAYNGGENSDPTKLPHGGATSVTYEVMGYAKNATKEYLFISCDYTAAQTGGQAWSYVLVR